jgi:hypothetical protein
MVEEAEEAVEAVKMFEMMERVKRLFEHFSVIRLEQQLETDHLQMWEIFANDSLRSCHPAILRSRDVVSEASSMCRLVQWKSMRCLRVSDGRGIRGIRWLGSERIGSVILEGCLIADHNRRVRVELS